MHNSRNYCSECLNCQVTWKYTLLSFDRTFFSQQFWANIDFVIGLEILFGTVIIRDTYHFREVEILANRVKVYNRTVNCAVYQDASFGCEFSYFLLLRVFRYSSDHDECVKLYEHSVTSPGLFHITHHFPFFCDCIESSDCLTICFFFDHTTKNIESAIESDNRLVTDKFTLTG